MNRIDRLFGILLLLQSRRQIRAQDIAARYEISERTVYRDVAALMELGVPVVSQAGTGYAIMEGYFSPPLVLSAAETKALLLGLKMLEASGNMPADAEDTAAKLQAALPAHIIRQVKPFIEIIGFYMERGRFDLNAPYLVELQRAIQHRQVVEMHYHSYRERRTTRRQVEPFRLTYSSGNWYVSAYCRLRKGVRHFRLDRIEYIQPLAETFETDHVLSESGPPLVTVRVRFPLSLLRWVRERQHYGVIDEEIDDATMICTYLIHDLSEIKGWIMGWGADANILEPQALRQQIREEAEKWISLLT